MKIKLALFTLLIVSIFNCKSEDTKEKNTIIYQKDLVDLVNPLMGTDSKYSLSNGNTYPAIATLGGMNFWTPMTSKMGDGWTYKYNESKLKGIKQTHQPSQ